MEELKTLKDITRPAVNAGGISNPDVWSGELRIEAVKWIEKYKKEIDFHCDEKGLTGVIVCECESCTENRGAIRAFKELFNITEEDLK